VKAVKHLVEELKEHEIRPMRTINLYGSSKGVGWGSSLPYGVEYGTATDAATLGKANR